MEEVKNAHDHTHETDKEKRPSSRDLNAKVEVCPHVGSVKQQ